MSGDDTNKKILITIDEDVKEVLNSCLTNDNLVELEPLNHEVKKLTLVNL